MHVIVNTKTKKKNNTNHDKKNTSAKQYTYFVKTDYFDDKFIDIFFEKRGNWRKILDSEIDDYRTPNQRIDFIYLDGMNYINPRYYSLNANLKNAVDDTKRMISLKNNLMTNLSKLPNGRRFIMPQIELDMFKLVDSTANKKVLSQNRSENIINTNSSEYIKLRSSFYPNKVYIFKPITGMAGSGIRVFDKFADLLGYITKIIKFNKHLWNRGKGSIEKENNRIWVLQEYITNPYLIKKKDDKKYKFHIRHFYIYQPGLRPSFYKNVGKLALARAPYINGNWDDKYIHDTHFYKHDGEVFPDSLMLSPTKINYINKQINEFYKLLDSIITAKCYAESRNCFELFGVDLMITDKFELKVLEVNAGLGLGDILTQNKVELFGGIVDLIVDDYFPPANPLNIDKKSDALFTIIKTH